MRYLFCVFLALLCVVTVARSQSSGPTGTWRGTYQPPPVQIPFVLQVQKTSTGWMAKTQSPNQNFNFFPVDSFAVEKTHVTFVQSQFNVLFSGNLAGNTLSGTFAQSGGINKIFLVRVLPEGTPCSGNDVLTGEWRGTLEFNPTPIPFVLSVSGTGVNLGATTQTPTVNPTSFPVDSITYSGTTVSFRQAQFGVEFTGTVSGDALSGTITQNGYKNSISLRRQ
jgi:hypothetical protein